MIYKTPPLTPIAVSCFKRFSVCRSFGFVRWVWLLIFTGWTLAVTAQSDTLPTISRPSLSRLIVPPVLIGLGGLSATDNSVFGRYRVRETVLNHSNGYRTSLDDYLSYGPTGLLVGLTVAGVKGRSTPPDRAGFWLTANALAGIVTYGLKYTTHVERPDGSDNRSFPSGHTSFAFAGAGVLDREFGRTSVLIPIAGYTMAGATGYLRLVNDQHWVSDVLIGAGIGLLSAEAAYRVYPWLKRTAIRLTHRPRRI